MALVECYECKVNISTDAQSCPHCGARANRTNQFPVKSKTTAALLALFLGGIGAHKFYLGKWAWGVVYLLFCLTFIPAIVAFAEGIRYLMMSEKAFEMAYQTASPGFVLTAEGIATPETHVRCPDCRELVRRDANKCKHCGVRLIPQ